MAETELSGPGRRSSLLSTIIPDLTDRISRLDDQYCEAGGYGDVFRCRYTGDDGIKEVAVKAFRFNFTVDERKPDEGRVARMIRRELGIWKRLSHCNVVPFLGVTYGFGRQGNTSLVSMWMPHGTLHRFLEAHDNQLTVVHRLQLLLDIANGLHYLHSFPIVHGDLSSNNVLLDYNYNACLTDFGCATLVGEHPEGFTYLKTSTLRPGTLRWAAPEHFLLDEDETKCTTKSDIYSFGNMALLVLSGKYPWSEVRADAAVMLRLSQGQKPGRPFERQIDDHHWALIERCWSSIPDRPLAEHVVSSLQHLLCVSPLAVPLCDLLDVPRISLVVPIDSRNSNMNSVAPIETPVDLLQSSAPVATIVHTPEDTTRYSDKQREVARPPLSKFMRGEVLGRGTYGHVYRALDVSTGEMIAVKRVEKGYLGSARSVDFVRELEKEREILSGLDHPHIITYLGSEETSTSLNILLEYIPGGTMGRHLREYDRFNEQVIKSFTAQIFDGLAYLHAKGIIHRNIEVCNILVDLSGICKISGLGNAQRVGDDRALWIPLRGVMPWTAPEINESRGGKRYGPKVDVWSAGCVLLEMWTGGRPSDEDLFALTVKAAHTGTFPPLPRDVTPPHLAADFRNRCFAIDPEARSSAAELVRHPYLTLPPDWVFTGFS